MAEHSNVEASEQMVRHQKLAQITFMKNDKSLTKRGLHLRIWCQKSVFHFLCVNKIHSYRFYNI